MPKLFKINGYQLYFWVNEGNPIELVHVHVSKGDPNPNSTKIWIMQNKKCLLANNDSKIPKTKLNSIIRIIEANVEEILDKWENTFGEVKFYC